VCLSHCLVNIAFNYMMVVPRECVGMHGGICVVFGSSHSMNSVLYSSAAQVQAALHTKGCTYGVSWHVGDVQGALLSGFSIYSSVLAHCLN